VAQALRIISFETLDGLHAEIETGDVVVHFASSDEEARYEQIEGKLTEQIEELLLQHVGDDEESNVFYINWDWFPNKGRSFMVRASAFTSCLVGELSCLLTGPYHDWRLFVTVCRDFSLPDHGHLGDACILQDRVLVSKPLHALLSNGA
jgi:hypothetical protein